MLNKLPILALTILAASAYADVTNINASERGFVCDVCGANPPDPANNYYAGFLVTTSEQKYRDWFEFAIPTLSSGPLTAATLELDEGLAARV